MLKLVLSTVVFAGDEIVGLILSLLEGGAGIPVSKYRNGKSKYYNCIIQTTLNKTHKLYLRCLKCCDSFVSLQRKFGSTCERIFNTPSS